jgi:DNA polymerase-4
VAPRGAAKQVSAETTFDTDLTAMADVHEAVARMTEAAHRRLLASGRAARTVTVKVRSADFTTASRSETAGMASTDLGALTAVAQRLAVAAVPEGGVRLIGVSLAGLGEDPPPALFEAFREEPVARPAADAQSEPDPVAVTALDAARPWRPGDDVAHPEHGHGWVQGAGHRRVTVRFETRSTGPGRARTFASDDPALTRADPLASLA